MSLVYKLLQHWVTLHDGKQDVVDSEWKIYLPAAAWRPIGQAGSDGASGRCHEEEEPESSDDELTDSRSGDLNHALVINVAHCPRYRGGGVTRRRAVGARRGAPILLMLFFRYSCLWFTDRVNPGNCYMVMWLLLP